MMTIKQRAEETIVGTISFVITIFSIPYIQNFISSYIPYVYANTILSYVLAYLLFQYVITELVFKIYYRIAG